MDPTYAPAIRGLDGGGTPSEDRAFGEEEILVVMERGARVVCESGMAGGLKHVQLKM